MWKKACAIFVTCLFFSAISGQKLAFQNFSTDKGLLQTQVYCIAQDPQRHLWVGTIGGMDRFDGTTFKHFTNMEGLNLPTVSCLYVAPNSDVWAGSQKDIACHNGKQIINYPVEGLTNMGGGFNTITSDEKNHIWAFHGAKGLFQLKGNKFIAYKQPFDGHPITCVYKDAKGNLVAGFYQKGVYRLSDGQWSKIPEMAVGPDMKVAALQQRGNLWYAFSDSVLYMYNGSTWVGKAPIPNGKFISCCINKKGDIWVGTDKGLLVFNGKDLTLLARYNGASGLTDNSINSLYADVEDNIWIGTDADGLFKFSDGGFGRYDKSNGLMGNVVMGIVKSKGGNLFIANREGGLVQYHVATKTIAPIDISQLVKGGINSIAIDKDDRLFVNKLSGGILQYYKGQWSNIVLNKDNPPVVNGVAWHGDKTWLATHIGLYYLKGNEVAKVAGINTSTFTILPLSDDNILVGTLQGLYHCTVNADSAIKTSIPLLQNLSISSLISKGDYIYIGTLNRGVYCWNRVSNKLYNCNTRDGLTDNQVFSLFLDSKQRIWAGTGFGVQQITFSESNGKFLVTRFSPADGFEPSESNLNAITEDNANQIWVGTTKGAYVFSGKEPVEYVKGPYVVIQQVTVSDTSMIGKEKTPWYPLPANLILPYSKNSISFTVKGIFMKHPEAVKYAYQLVGYDKEFSPASDQAFFNYQNLEPGEYIFRVKAYTTSGLESENIAEYPFTVATPFYKTTWFLLLIILALLLTGGLVQFLFMRARQRKFRQQAIIRKEEQQAIRIRTSEDFHDELGNKLTRISLLTDILQRKTDPDDTEKNKLIAQIKENVLALYGGTRDIIWSLSSGSDNLLETLKRIEQFGDELFHGSGVEFSFHGLENVDPTIVLPMDYSRNILMIFKESLNNTLKHAQCTKVKIEVEALGNNGLSITQNDNGRGFNEELVQKGNGLNNIRRRSQRINAGITISTTENNGASIALLLKIPPKG